MTDAQYAIDVAAQMTGGDHTIAQLDAMTAQLTGAGKGAEHFQQAIAKVSKDLDASRVAATGANAALAEGNAQYRILERAAEQAAKAVEKAGKQTKGFVDADLAKKARDATGALAAHTTQLRMLERNAASATAAESRLASTLGNLRKLSGHVDKSLAGAAERTEKLRGAMAAAGGSAGALGSKLLAPVQGFQKLSAEMGAGRAAMILTGVAAVGVSVAIVALAAAAVAGAVAIAHWAVGLADASRSAGLHREALEAMHPEIAALRGVIDETAKATGMHADELSGLAVQLQEAGIAAADLPDALRAAALAETALGQGGAQDFIADLKKAKGAAGALARETQAKLGGIVAKQMLGLDEQSARLKKNFTSLFSGLNIDPVIAGMQILVKLFDDSTASGQTIKFLFETLFQPFIDQSESAAVVFEAFVLGVEIAALRVYIAWHKTWKDIKEDFSLTDENAAKLNKTLTALGPVFDFLLWPIKLAGTVLAAAAGAFVSLGLTVAKVWASILGTLLGSDIVRVGFNLIAGLVSGITGSAGAVVDAVKRVVTGAIDKAKSLLGIHSKSTVFGAIGEYTGEGFVYGVDRMTGDAQAAMAGMVEPPDAGVSSLAMQDVAKRGASVAAAAGASSAPARSGAAGSLTLNVQQVTFNGVKDAEDAMNRWGEWLTRHIEGRAAQIGGAEAPVES